MLRALYLDASSGPVCQRKDWGSGHKYECPNLKQQHKAQVEAAGQAKPPFLDPNEDAPVPRQVLFPYDVFLQLRKTSSSCKRAPIGLTNHGNNCYANAALQCLLFTQPLRAYLDQGLHSRQCNKPHDKDWCLLCVLSVGLRRGSVMLCRAQSSKLFCAIRGCNLTKPLSTPASIQHPTEQHKSRS